MKNQLLVLLLLALPVLLRATLITNFQTSAASQTAFPVSSSDLINAGSPAVSHYADADYTAETLDSYGPTSALVDGDGGGTTGFIPSPGGVLDGDGTWSFMVFFDLGFSPSGYDIAEIQTFTGHTDNRKSQWYTLYASSVGDDSFYELGTFHFDYNTPLQGSTRLVIMDDAGFIATGVDALRWDVEMPSSGYGSVYREFDVYTSRVKVPESSSVLLLLAISCVGLLLWYPSNPGPEPR